MQKRKLAATGIDISPIGLGTVKFGRNQGVKYPEQFALPDDKHLRELLAQAKAAGINLLDTAPAYGSSEARLGQLLLGQRQDWVICSKVGEEFQDGESEYIFTPEHTRFSVQRSLQRLNTDYIDIVLVHSNGDDMNIINHSGVLDTLAQLKQDGIIRAFGMSTKTIEGGLRAAELTDAVMVTYNLKETADAAVLEYCAKHNKAALIKKAFSSGHLDSSDPDPVKTSMKFIFQQAGVSSIILGTINPEHLQHNIETAELLA